MIKYGIIILLLSSCFFCNAQEVETTVKNGKVYYIHIVEPGNTLYGLKTKYDVSIESILQANPEASESLQIGQRILIPTDISPEKINEEKDHIIHTVKRKETLFGISKEYDCTIEKLIAANPETEKGLKVGQKLIIPCQKGKEETTTELSEEIEETKDSSALVDNYIVSFEDSIVKYTVQKGETLYSISKRFMVSIERLTEINNIKRNKIKPGDILTIPLKKERIERIEVKPIAPSDSIIDTLFSPDIEHKETYTISVLLPLKIGKNASIITGLIDDKTRLNDISDIAVDFLLGVEKALDSLEKLGLSANVHVFDTEGSLIVTKKIIQKDEVKHSDLVFGPFFPEPIKYVSEWAKTNKKQIIIPVSANTEIIKNNPYITLIVPSELTLIGGMAKYLAQTHSDDNIMLIEGKNQAENERIAYFKKVYQESLTETPYNPSIKTLALGSSSGRDLARTFELDTHNIFVCLSDNAQGIMRFINTLNAAKNQSERHGKTKVTVVGLRNWQNLDALSSYYKNRFELHTALPNYLSYREERTKAFTKAYQSELNADPSRFTFQGFDVVFGICAEKLLNIPAKKGFMNQFDINKVGERNGYENATVFIVKQQEYELILQDIVTHPFLRKEKEANSTHKEMMKENSETPNTNNEE